MRYIILSVILVCASVDLFGQITIKNLTAKNFTNAYIIEYDSLLKTDGFCDFILTKNLLKKRLDSNKQVLLNFKLQPFKYYNLVCLDTSEQQPSYSFITFKYHFSGKAKLITIDSTNIEKDFWGHCTEGVADQNFEDLILNVINNKNGTIIKLYFKFNEGDEFKRYLYFHQWHPITAGAFRQMTLYNSKPKGATKIYLKYYIEKDGIITADTIEGDLTPAQKGFYLIIRDR